jgi:hypothetical protein
VNASTWRGAALREAMFGRSTLGGAALGALAGVAGGAAFGAAMAQLGSLPSVASLVRAQSATVGLAVHMLIAITVGAGFGLLVAARHASAGETLFWGLTYGALWWFLGPLTLLPLFTGRPLAWHLDAAQAQVPSLLGHLLYGAVTALALVGLHRFGGHPGIGSPRRVCSGAPWPEPSPRWG